MKKSKIFFILTAVFVVITIGTFFYKNSCKQKIDDYYSIDKNFAWDIALKNGRITQYEYEQEMRYQDDLENNEEMSNTIFMVIIGITVVILATGIVFKVKEKKEEK